MRESVVTPTFFTDKSLLNSFIYRFLNVDELKIAVTNNMEKAAETRTNHQRLARCNKNKGNAIFITIKRAIKTDFELSCIRPAVRIPQQVK